MSDRIVWVDTETTGTDDKKHGIIQIGAVLTDLLFNTLAYFQTLVKPFQGCEITEEALAINGRTREELENAPDEHAAFTAFWRFCELANYKENNWPRFAGFACKFDLGMMDALARRVFKGQEPKYPYRVPWLCMLEESRKNLPDLPKRKCDRPNCRSCATDKDHTHRLVDVCHHYGFELEAAHDAMGDLKGTIIAAKIQLIRVEPLELQIPERAPF